MATFLEKRIIGTPRNNLVAIMSFLKARYSGTSKDILNEAD